jgi:hypothetical protein
MISVLFGAAGTEEAQRKPWRIFLLPTFDTIFLTQRFF